jgi:tRNA pseudouridine55 synthase
VPIRGLLNLNKPSGITSRGAIDLVCRLAGKTKVGHAGTLDPLASGVLVVGVGAATRLIEYVQRMPKHYTATFLLGRQSETEDIESLVVELDDPPIPTREEIVAATGRFCGRIQQRPPAYSAVKVAGRRAYALARAGREVELDARPITVHRLEVRAYAYPTLTLEVRCGGGTYVRSLGRDLAASLGTAAVMSELVRTAIGGFRIEQSVDPARDRARPDNPRPSRPTRRAGVRRNRLGRPAGCDPAPSRTGTAGPATESNVTQPLDVARPPSAVMWLT